MEATVALPARRRIGKMGVRWGDQGRADISSSGETEITNPPTFRSLSMCVHLAWPAWRSPSDHVDSRAGRQQAASLVGLTRFGVPLPKWLRLRSQSGVVADGTTSVTAGTVATGFPRKAEKNEVSESSGGAGVAV